uniref:Pentatricopeptide repeat-containing protein At5g62370-like n=1 Tax=Nicotiana tabacum TaxID=4097 RepID=A0A1S4C6W7_TOBAC|nr:PREDICTED: pentatricopeptide repeat-containing protein At5g62370-like [Nicotiana tabacum]
MTHFQSVRVRVSGTSYSVRALMTFSTVSRSRLSVEVDVEGWSVALSVSVCSEQLILRGLFGSAQKVIQRIIKQSSSVSEAISAVEFSISRGIEPDATSYSFLIRQLVASGETQMAEDIYVYCILKRGIEPKDQSLLNSMAICYCNLGKLEEAKLLFDKLLDMKLRPCSSTCTALIKGFCGQHIILDGFDVFVVAVDAGVSLSFSCYNRLVDGLCHRGFLDEALYVFDIMCERGVTPNVHLFKTLVLSLCKRGRVEEAELLSMDMESYGFVLDKVMYTTLINGYSKNKKMKMAMRMFIRMLKLGCAPDKYTYNTLMHGFFNLGMLDKGWVLHQQMAEFGLEPDAVSYQIMIGKYCKDHKVDCALMLLNNMIQCNVAPSVHSYTALIAALCKENRLAEVDVLYNKMLDNGLVPDHVLFFTLVNNLPRGYHV